MHGLLSAVENSIQCSLLLLQSAMHSWLLHVENAMKCNAIQACGKKGENPTLPFRFIIDALFFAFSMCACGCALTSIVHRAQDGARRPQGVLKGAELTF